MVFEEENLTKNKLFFELESRYIESMHKNNIMPYFCQDDSLSAIILSHYKPLIIISDVSDAKGTNRSRPNPKRTMILSQGKLTLLSIGKTLNRWMNKQDKRDIEE